MNSAIVETVETASGRLAGLRKDGITRFKGVPFAKPPVGALALAHAASRRAVDGRARRHEIRPCLPASAHPARNADGQHDGRAIRRLPVPECVDAGMRRCPAAP